MHFQHADLDIMSMDIFRTDEMEVRNKYIGEQSLSDAL